MGLWRQSSHTPWESVLSRSMDSATSPSAPRRMTGMGDILWKVKVFGLEKPGIRESDAMRIGCWLRAHWMLMLCAMAVTSLRIDVDAECTDVNFAFIGCWRFVYCLKMLCKLILMLFTKTAETACIDFWLIHELSFEQERFLSCAFIAAYFNELVSSSTLTPPSCHSARRVYTKLQNPLFHKAKENLLPERVGALRADEEG